MSSFPRLLDIILEQSDEFIAVVSIETCTLGCRMDTKCCLHHMIHSSLVPRPSHVFQCTWEKSGRSGQFGDVMVTYLPPFLTWFFYKWWQIRHHCITKSTMPSSRTLKNMGRPGYEARSIVCLKNSHGRPIDVVVLQVYHVMFHVPVRPLVQAMSLWSIQPLLSTMIS